MVLLLYRWLLPVTLFAALNITQPAFITNKFNEEKVIYHPFYISVTELTHNKQAKYLEVSCKIFTDDLEGTLKQNYKTAFNLLDEKREVQNGNYINDYINRHLKIAADGKTIQLKYVGYEIDKEATYCYFECLNLPSVKKLDVENSILQDFTNQQINIIHVTVNSKRQSTKLDFPDKKASFSF